MRDAVRLQETVDEYFTRERELRRRRLGLLLVELKEARDRRAEWYVWVRDVWPTIKAPRP